MFNTLKAVLKYIFEKENTWVNVSRRHLKHIKLQRNKHPNNKSFFEGMCSKILKACLLSM